MRDTMCDTANKKYNLEDRIKLYPLALDSKVSVFSTVSHAEKNDYWIAWLPEFPLPLLERKFDNRVRVYLA